MQEYCLYLIELRVIKRLVRKYPYLLPFVINLTGLIIFQRRKNKRSCELDKISLSPSLPA